MFVKVINSYRCIVAACDKDLIGKTFEEGQLQLNAKESFYKEEEVSKKEIIELFQNYAKEDATFNLIGKEVIDSALKAGIIKEENIGTIQNIPYALILL
jgi:hypothetical protein